MLGCVFFIALGSVFAKMLLNDTPAHQVLWLRMVGYLAVMAPITLALNRKDAIKPVNPSSHLIRGTLGFLVALLLLIAIQDVGVSQAIAAFYIYPALTYLAGVTWLGEPSSSYKWIAVGLGFSGVIIALQPEIEPKSIMQLSTGLGYAFAAAGLAAIRISLHRRDSAISTPMTSALWDRGVGAILATALIIFYWTPMNAIAYDAMIGLVLSSIAAQLLLVYALARTPLGSLAPFTYWEVIFAFLLDSIVLGTPFSSSMFLGALLILTAGVFFSRKRQRH